MTVMVMGSQTSQFLRSASLTRGRPGFVRVAGACSRCGGAGGAEAWRFTGWTCFRCGGSGQEPGGYREWAYPADWTDEQCAESAAKREAKTAARRQAKADKKAAPWAAFKAEHGSAEDWEVAEAFRNANGFIGDVLWRGAHFGSLSDAQLAAIGDSVRRDIERAEAKAAEAAALRPVPTGTVVIEGVVLSKKSQEGQWGSTLKMLVKGQGWKVWGTVPTFKAADGTDEYVEVGDTVRFTASVEVSGDDENFGFFKRPRKATIVERGPDGEDET